MPHNLRNRPTSQRASLSMTSTRHSTYHGGDQVTEALLSATVEELRAFTVKTLRQHLAACNLSSSGTKAILAHHLYNAIHGESLPAMLTENPTSSPITASSTSYTITQPVETATLESFTPTQILVTLQLLSQELQTRVSQPQMNATSSQLLGNAPPMFSTAQQGSNNIIAYGPPISLHPNDDALSTASSVLPNAGVTQTDPLGPVLSQSLPPVPVALRQRILKGEYIDFSTLLPEVMFLVATSTPSPNAGRSTGQSL